MKISKGKIVLAVLLVLLIVTGVRNIKQRKADNEKILKQVTIVSDGKVKAENEGKLVLVSGEIDYENPIDFEELDYTLNTFKITRTVKDFVSFEKDGKTHYEWQERTEPKHNVYRPLDLLYTIEEVERPTVGEFTLDDYGLEHVRTNTSYSDNETIYGLAWNGMEYTNPNRDEEEVGDVSVTYEYFDVDKCEYLTILAKQKGNSFEPYKLGKTQIYSIYEGKVTSTDMLKEKLDIEVKQSKRGRIAFIVLILAIAGIVAYDKKKNGKRSDEKKSEATETPAEEPKDESEKSE